MFSFVTSNFYLMNVLFSLSIGFIAKLAFSPVKPKVGSILSDIWIWLGLGALGSVLASFVGSWFGWTDPQVSIISLFLCFHLKDSQIKFVLSSQISRRDSDCLYHFRQQFFRLQTC
jgi:uncharacterized membrane protein YeaQ/YmgE (transglycosylase-associated protein family)